MTHRNYFLSLGLIVLAALGLQLGMFGAGLYRLTSDESARILTAWHLSGTNALEPFLWPPFYKLFVGTALKLYPNIFVTPRILVCLAGLLSLLSVTWLTTALFRDRRISIIAAMLALLAPHRLLFSVVPLSDIYYFFFIVSAATLVVNWIRTSQAWPLLGACGCILLAESVRFEAGLFAVFLETLLLYRGLIRRDLSFVTLCLSSLILFIFPVLWAANSYAWYGSLSNINVASEQFIGEFGRNYAYAIKWSPLRFFIQDIIWNPLTLPGLAAVVWLSLRDRAILIWTLLFAVPLLVFSVYTVVTFSIPTAATWRTSGVWTLMMLPFDAFVVLRIGTILNKSFRTPRPILAVLLLLAILPMGVRSLWYMHDGLRNNDTLKVHQEHKLDAYLDLQLASSPGSMALVDSSNNLDYLDLLAFSHFPDRLMLTAAGDPVRIGFYEPMRQAYAGRPDVSVFLTDRFNLEHGGALQMFTAHHIRLVVVRNPAFLHALDASSLVTPVRHFNDWTIYGVKPTLLPTQLLTGATSKAMHLTHHAG